MPKENAGTKDPMNDFVVKEFDRYENFHRDRFNQAQKDYDNWIGKAPKREHPWMNAVHVPVTFEGEQTITPRLFTALFPTDAPVDVKVEGEAAEQQGIRIKGIIQHYFRICDVQGEAHDSMSDASLFGTGYIEGGSWYVKQGWVHDRESGVRYKTLIESRPDCKFVSFFEIFPHPAKRRMDDDLPLIRRRFSDAEFLKKLGNNPEMKIKNLAKALDSTVPMKSGMSTYMNKKRDEYEILEYWGPWDESYTGSDGTVVKNEAVPHWITVVNRSVVIRAIPNPYDHQMPPFCKLVFVPDRKNSWFGVGVGQIGRSTQERLNKLVNQRLDNVDLVLNKQGCYNGSDTFLNTKKLQVSKPGLWHKVQDVTTTLKWMETPDVTASAYQEEALAKQDFRESTGATAQLMPGNKSEQHRTALGIQILQGAAGERFRPILRRLEVDLIQKLAMFFFSNLKQFMTEPEWVLITGKNGRVEPIEITPEQIQAKVLFVPTGISETVNKEAQINNLMRYKEITQQDPTINRQEINKRIGELFGFKDVEKLLTPMQAPAQGTGMSPEQQYLIQQRLNEGASPDQIKQEMLGTPPPIKPGG